MNFTQRRILFRAVALFLSFLLLFQQAGFAQGLAQLDIAGHLAGMRNSLIQDKFRPLHLRYLQFNPQGNTFRLLLDKGDTKNLQADQLENASKELMKYFLIGLSLPNDSFWVNLRPDSPDNIIDPFLEDTDIGRIMLEADLQLKKDTAAMTSPQTPEGREYWGKLYKKAEELFGSENITIPTLTRPWIVPDEIIVRETTDSAYIYKATLKVMLEQDYLKDSTIYSFKDPRLKELNEYSSQLIRELIIPKLTKQVNSSKRYANLRQVYYSLIMAQWFKARQGLSPKGTVLGPYVQLIDSRNLTNLTCQESYSKKTCFQAYQKSFKDGEYNVKEPVYTPFGQTIRSYFSGGISGIAPVVGGFGQETDIVKKVISGIDLSRDEKLLEVRIDNQGNLQLQTQRPQDLPFVEGGMADWEQVQKWIAAGDIAALAAHITRSLQGVPEKAAIGQIDAIVSGLTAERRQQLQVELEARVSDSNLLVSSLAELGIRRIAFVSPGASPSAAAEKYFNKFNPEFGDPGASFGGIKKLRPLARASTWGRKVYINSLWSDKMPEDEMERVMAQEVQRARTNYLYDKGIKLWGLNYVGAFQELQQRVGELYDKTVKERGSEIANPRHQYQGYYAYLELLSLLRGYQVYREQVKRGLRVTTQPAEFIEAFREDDLRFLDEDYLLGITKGYEPLTPIGNEQPPWFSPSLHKDKKRLEAIGYHNLQRALFDVIVRGLLYRGKEFAVNLDEFASYSGIEGMRMSAERKTLKILALFDDEPWTDIHPHPIVVYNGKIINIFHLPSPADLIQNHKLIVIVWGEQKLGLYATALDNEKINIDEYTKLIESKKFEDALSYLIAQDAITFYSVKTIPSAPEELYNLGPDDVKFIFEKISNQEALDAVSKIRNSIDLLLEIHEQRKKVWENDTFRKANGYTLQELIKLIDETKMAIKELEESINISKKEVADSELVNLEYELEIKRVSLGAYEKAYAGKNKASGGSDGSVQPLASPTINSPEGNPGGIDFRFLPIVTQAITNLSAGMGALPLERVSVLNLDSEWQEIERMSEAGITPSAERIKEYLQASCYNGRVQEDKERVVLCISGILRQEEEEYVPTDPILRDILVVLEAGYSQEELENLFRGVKT